MNLATLESFRTIADDMRSARGESTPDWQWIGVHLSQRMIGIPRERAEHYARTYGGRAEPVPQESAR